MTWNTLRRLGVALLIVSALALASSALMSKGIAAPAPSAPASGDTTAALDRVEWEKVAGLLRQESVRKEIGLRDDDYRALADFRKVRLATIVRQFDTGLKGVGQQNVGGGAQKTSGQQAGDDPINAAVAEVLDQHLKALRELETEITKKTTDALTPPGVKRLKQVVLQAAGPRGLLERVAIRELQLTAEQEDKIAAAVGPARPPRNIVLPNAWLQKAAKDQDAIIEAALKLLTADQRKRWETLVGKPVPTIDLLKAGPMSGESIAEFDGE